MSIKSIQDILPLIEQPSRYLGSEINTIKKDHSKTDLSFALAFPDLYEIGTSHFGLQILYHILNRHPKIAAERVFAPAPDMEEYLRSSGLSVASLESNKPLKEFDIIGFSLLYELNYTNVLSILNLAGIPFLSRQRDGSFPFVIAGGPCTCNPEPVADFFDAMVIGDGEKVIIKMCRAWLEWKSDNSRDKEILLKQWSHIEGVYIPEFFNAEFDHHGFQTIRPKYPDYDMVKKAVVGDLNDVPFPDTPIIPYGKPVHDRLRLEISRGCTRGCRFCQAGMIYRPVRERSLKTLLSLSDASVAATGYEDISLLSLSTGDYSCILPLMENMMSRYANHRIAISLPSLRAGTLTPSLMNLIKKVRKTGFTIAPEAGSQRLRDVINKNITEKDIIDTVNDAFLMGWQVVKLYFMVGLPTETDDDLEAIVDLVKRLKTVIRQNRRKGQINVSITTFIPKPHTPFQWSSQISLDESKHKITWLKKKLKIPGVRFKWQKPEVSIIEGLWARGDRRLNRLLLAAYNKGCKFDGWSDKFGYRSWEASLLDEGVDIDFFTTRVRNIIEPLPWDHIDTMVSKDYLISEWNKAAEGVYTVDCRNGNCNQCGVCDFEAIEPKVFNDLKEDMVKNFTQDRPTPKDYKKLKISFSKLCQAKYFGHLEMVKIFFRAIRRAGIAVKYSEGFHPKPLISFEDALPIGLESMNEIFYLSVHGNVKPQTIINGLNCHLPKGLRILDCHLAPIKSSNNIFEPFIYMATYKNGFFDEEKMNHFNKMSEFIVTRFNRKGKTKKINLKEMVINLVLLAPNQLRMILRSEPGQTVRPFEVLEKIFGLSKVEIKQAAVVKL
ncbi:MAG: TIGR03960 family B12-binding radical SAM protein [Deltaproteobacteria bacterium]|nr:TIGR03960 family B12-binding radical SAM protein [Deltaproteobacteria bacterium]